MATFFYISFEKKFFVLCSCEVRLRCNFTPPLSSRNTRYLCHRQIRNYDWISLLAGSLCSFFEWMCAHCECSFVTMIEAKRQRDRHDYDIYLKLSLRGLPERIDPCGKFDAALSSNWLVASLDSTKLQPWKYDTRFSGGDMIHI